MSGKRLEISPRTGDSISPMQEQQQQQQSQHVVGDRIPAPPSSALAADEMQSLLSQVLVDLVEAKRRTERQKTAKRKDQEASDVKHTRMAKALGKIPCIGATLKAKYLNSKLVSYLEGVGVRSEDVDGLVNSVTLVNALILTIPPGIVTSLGINSGTWDTLETAIATCNIDGSDLFWYEQVYIPIWKDLVGGMVTSVFGLVVAILYYILRPASREDDEEKEQQEEQEEQEEGEGEEGVEGERRPRKNKSGFQLWWKRGRVGVLLLCTAVLISAICIFLVITYLMLFFVTNDGHLCDLVQAKMDRGAWALLPLQSSTIITAICVYVLFFWAALWCLL